MGTSCNQIQNCIFRDKSQECKCSQLKGSTFTIKSVSIQVGWHWCCKHYIQINRKQGTCSFSTRASNSLILAWDISDASSSSCLSRCSVPISSVIFLFSSYIRNTKTGDAAGLPGGQVVKALDYRPRGYSNKDFFHLGVYSALPKKVSRCILRVFSPEVYTASFGGDVKPSVPGDLV